jgi:ParB/RepB/Spo0J family partition protein
MDDKVEFLPTQVLREPKTKLRDIDKESIEFLELCDSLREKGFLNSILVRPQGDTGEVFEIVDGLCRFTASKEIGLPLVPCIIREISDKDVLALQIQANAISLETKPAEYAHQIKKMMALDPDLTQSMVARLIRKSPSWVGNLLSLPRLLVDVQKMVDRGEISLQNAYMLAKIPRSMQKDYVDKAKLMPAKEFKALAAACVKHFQEAVKQGKMDAFYADKFQPVAHLRSCKEVEDELFRKTTGALTCATEGCQSVLDGFYAGLRWVCHLDRPSVQEQEDNIRKQRERQVLDVRLSN